MAVVLTSGLNLNGTSDSISISGTPLNIATDTTWECWLRLDSLPPGGNYATLFFRQYHDGTQAQGPINLLMQSNGKFYYALQDAAQNNHLIDAQNTALVAGTSYHVAFVRAGSEQALYVDGIKDGSIYWTGNLKQGYSDMKIGCGEQTNHTLWRFLDGSVDEVRVSDIARYTATFAAGSSEFTSDANTIYLGHFNDGSVADSSSNNLAGSAIGAIWVPGLAYSGQDAGGGVALSPIFQAGKFWYPI